MLCPVPCRWRICCIRAGDGRRTGRRAVLWCVLLIFLEMEVLLDLFPRHGGECVDSTRVCLITWFVVLDDFAEVLEEVVIGVFVKSHGRFLSELFLELGPDLCNVCGFEFLSSVDNLAEIFVDICGGKGCQGAENGFAEHFAFELVFT